MVFRYQKYEFIFLLRLKFSPLGSSLKSIQTQPKMLHTYGYNWHQCYEAIKMSIHLQRAYGDYNQPKYTCTSLFANYFMVKLSTSGSMQSMELCISIFKVLIMYDWINVVNMLQ